MEIRGLPVIAEASGPSAGSEVLPSASSRTLPAGCGCHGWNYLESSM